MAKETDTPKDEGLQGNEKIEKAIQSAIRFLSKCKIKNIGMQETVNQK